MPVPPPSSFIRNVPSWETESSQETAMPSTPYRDDPKSGSRPGIVRANSTRGSFPLEGDFEDVMDNSETSFKMSSSSAAGSLPSYLPMSNMTPFARRRLRSRLLLAGGVGVLLMVILIIATSTTRSSDEIMERVWTAQELEHCQALVLNGVGEDSKYASPSPVETWDDFLTTVHSAFSDNDRCHDNIVPLGDTESLECRCHDPTLPLHPHHSDEYTKLWENAEEQNAARIDQYTGEPLDVVMLGDAMTEHWFDTDLGREAGQYKENKHVFEQLFRPEALNSKATVSGLALGISGDRVTELLYRFLNNYELDHRLQPAVWWIMIGTNDLMQDSCGAEAIIAGNIAIVEEIRKARPDATIVINSILPRGKDGEIEPAWEEVIAAKVNPALECYAAGQDNVEYYNASPLFLSPNSKFLNAAMYRDHGVHPGGFGSWTWGRAIVTHVENIKRKHKMRSLEISSN